MLEWLKAKQLRAQQRNYCNWLGQNLKNKILIKRAFLFQLKRLMTSEIWKGNTNSPELSLLNFFCDHGHFLATTLDFFHNSLLAGLTLFYSCAVLTFELDYCYLILLQNASPAYHTLSAYFVHINLMTWRQKFFPVPFHKLSYRYLYLCWVTVVQLVVKLGLTSLQILINGHS